MIHVVLQKFTCEHIKKKMSRFKLLQKNKISKDNFPNALIQKLNPTVTGATAFELCS